MTKQIKEVTYEKTIYGVMMRPGYKKILLKLSGEGLASKNGVGFDTEFINKLALEIKAVRKIGVKICLVVGGGNFFRGAQNSNIAMDRSVADQIGMLATLMNALAIKSALDSNDCPAEIFSGLMVPQVCDNYSYRKAKQSLDDNKIVIFAGGTGSPYFTTDTGAVLRASEMHCDIVMKATQVDGVYDSDPRKNKKAKRYDEIGYSEVLEKHLNVMDMTAIALARENKMPIMVFALSKKDAILNAVCAKAECTIIK